MNSEFLFNHKMEYLHLQCLAENEDYTVVQLPRAVASGQNISGVSCNCLQCGMISLRRAFVIFLSQSSDAKS